MVINSRLNNLNAYLILFQDSKNLIFFKFFKNTILRERERERFTYQDI